MTDIVEKVATAIELVEEHSSEHYARAAYRAVLEVIREPSDQTIRAMLGGVGGEIDTLVALGVITAEEGQSRKDAAFRKMRSAFSRAIDQLIKELENEGRWKWQPTDD